MKTIKLFLLSILLLTVILRMGVSNTFAGVFDVSREPLISFTFDDGDLSVYTNVLPILQPLDIPGVAYIPTGYMGQEWLMSWEQLLELQNVHNWEIGGHGVNHYEMPPLSDELIEYEVLQCREDLEQNGLIVTTFATPMGAYDERVLTAISRHFDAHRGFWDRDDYNSLPHDKYILMVQSVESE
ncbi:polysaccharide deacetylase family protein, partial [Patescibacteria group bacterium]|nr:polysaccharide deacetylase family protein [Patescibacteria group bacterium]